MAKLFLLPFMAIAVSTAERLTVVPYPSYGYAYSYNVPASVVPASVQSRLGPFFGYFPSMFATRCPTCPTCPVTPKCPVAPAPTDTLAECGEVSASPSGTIKFTSSASGTINCIYTIVTFEPYSKITVNCVKIGGGVTLVPASSVTGDVTENKDFPVTGNIVTITVKATPEAETIDCTWTST